jgi:hypothetical protein
MDYNEFRVSLISLRLREQLVSAREEREVLHATSPLQIRLAARIEAFESALSIVSKSAESKSTMIKGHYTPSDLEDLLK